MAVLVGGLAGPGTGPAAAQAPRQVSLEWDANSETDLDGYLVMAGQQPGVADQTIDVGKQTSASLSIPWNQATYAWVQAYSTSGERSISSNVVSFPASVQVLTGGTTTTDPSVTWEQQVDAETAAADPDNDGLTNQEEGLKSTSPWLPNRWYFAEGGTGGFNTRFAFVNPLDSVAVGMLTLHLASGDRIVPFTVGPRARYTLDVNKVLEGSLETAFSATVTVVRGGIAVERTMQWARTAGGPVVAGHTGGSTRLSTLWFFANGDTRTLDSYLLLANESDRTALSVVQALSEDGLRISQTLAVPPRGRLAVHLNQVPGLESTRFWMTTYSDVPIAAEQSSYLERDHAWAGGDVTSGVTRPAKTWYFADGVIGALQDTFLTLANPQGYPVVVSVTWFRTHEPPILETRTIAPAARLTLSAEDVPGLSGAFGVAVTATAPIVAERSMFWPGTSTSWLEMHSSAGASQAGTRWIFAEGEVGGPSGVETYLSVLNPGSQSATVTVTALREKGSPVGTTMVVPASTRSTLRLRDLALSSGERFAIEVDSSSPVVAERPLYWGAEGWYTRGGTSGQGYKVY